MKTSYGLEFLTLGTDELDRFNGYNKVVAQCHIANCGRIIVDAVYEQPIDNEFDLEEAYRILNGVASTSTDGEMSIGSHRIALSASRQTQKIHHIQNLNYKTETL